MDSEPQNHVQRYQRNTDLLRVRLADTACGILGSVEEFERTLEVSFDLARNTRASPGIVLAKCGELWCNDQDAASTLTKAFLDRLQLVIRDRRHETLLQKARSNRTEADRLSDERHKHFTGIIEGLLEMFSEVWRRNHPRSTAQYDDSQDSDKYIARLEHLDMDTSSHDPSDEDLTACSEPRKANVRKRSQGKQRKHDQPQIQSRTSKAKELQELS